MKTVHRSQNIIEAHLVRHRLEEAGIPVFVLGEHLLGGVGELPAAGLIQVCVPDDVSEEAERLVAELSEELRQPLDEELMSGEPDAHAANTRPDPNGMRWA